MHTWGNLLNHRYELLKQIGVGFLGTTYLAMDVQRSNPSRCVVKQLMPVGFGQANGLSRQTLLELFEEEILVLKRLGEHPQIPQILDRFIENEQFYVVQDYIEGHSLRTEIKLAGPQSEDAVKALLKDSLEILQFVHQNQSVHRNLKPENLIRQSDRQLSLIDFGGLKELMSSTIDETGEATAIVLGTPGYLAPEQARGKAFPSSDIYALGMIAIEALTGIPPRQLPNDRTTGEITWQEQASVSDRLATLLNRMICQQPSQRYQSAAQARQALTLPSTLTFPLPLPRFKLPAPESTPVTPLPELDEFLTSASSQTAIAQLEPAKTRSLQVFKFQTATLLLVKQKGLRHPGHEICRAQEQAAFFTEDLGGVPLEMIAIPEGEFLMGSSAREPGRSRTEGPQHLVNIRQFFMSKMLITQAQWRTIAALPKINWDLNPDASQFQGDDRPVECVSWYEAVEFCDRLSRHTGLVYRLPSEAEWEYACRAGTSTPFHCDATIISELANYCGKIPYKAGAKGIHRRETTPVGSFPANAFGLYDMHGNLWEWCLDHWHENYQGAPSDGSAWCLQHEEHPRVVRGGSWLSYPHSCRSAARDFCPPDARNEVVGFRIAATPE